MITRSILAAGIFLVYLFLWQRKRKAMLNATGIDPDVIYDDPRPTQRYVGRLLRLLTAAILILVLLHSLGLRDIPGFHLFWTTSHRRALLLALAVALPGLMLCALAQRQMGTAWRVGIDRKRSTPLIQTGLFAHSRNPTYLGLFFIVMAVFFLFPSPVIILWIAAFILVVEFQVRLEEEALLEQHGDEYRRYLTRVKRYIPGLY